MITITLFLSLFWWFQSSGIIFSRLAPLSEGHSIGYPSNVVVERPNRRLPESDQEMYARLCYDNIRSFCDGCDDFNQLDFFFFLALPPCQKGTVSCTLPICDSSLLFAPYLLSAFIFLDHFCRAIHWWSVCDANDIAGRGRSEHAKSSMRSWCLSLDRFLTPTPPPCCLLPISWVPSYFSTISSGRSIDGLWMTKTS